jgi:hypothetical protein
VREELSEHRRSDYHVPLLSDEVQARSTEPTLHDLTGQINPLLNEPVRGAHLLASAVTALGFHHEFLMHAASVMLAMEDRPFVDRLAYMMEWWLNNSERRPIIVAFRRLESGQAAGGRRVKYHELPTQMQGSLLRNPKWLSEQPDGWQDTYEFQTMSVAALDINSAADLAREHHRTLRARMRAKGKTTAAVDTFRPLAWDEFQQPEPARALTWRLNPYRFPEPQRFRSGRPLSQFHEACEQDPVLGSFATHYLEATIELHEGRPDDAFDHLCKSLDLVMATPGTTDIGRGNIGLPRRLVEHGATLLALDWQHLRFRHIMNYLSAPSPIYGGISPLGGERRPERVLTMIADDDSWTKIFKRCSWDEFLAWHRNRLLQEMANPGPVIASVRSRIEWDLARAVRSRNRLFHEGRPLLAEHILAVFIAAIDHVVRLRVVATREHVRFEDIVRLAEMDLRIIIDRNSLSNMMDHTAFGWRSWRSRSGAMRLAGGID